MNDKSKSTGGHHVEAAGECNPAKKDSKTRGKKRKRQDSESSDYEDVLPENTLEMEKNLHASAIKNNLDDISVRKILKKVVTNDHVLALVKLREEEDSGPEEDSLRPKLTRSKVKELMRVSPKTAGWNLELTPIKHIPVKTRPEVKALIAQELPDDEDDDEYRPTHEDILSDDDQGLESCSDLESQPKTPATPASQHEASPKVVNDGPFKVPQEATAAVRKPRPEQEATIARRTRSKLSLSTTSIEHIERAFVPPDEPPLPAVDDLWTAFLSDCLDPAAASRAEDDDDADPEYNAAADADAHDEDEETLSNSIIKISKKELNDLVTELFNIMPDASVEEDLAGNLASSVLTEHSQNEIDATQWEGKQEPLSDEENSDRLVDRITFENKGYTRVSIGKSEIEDPDIHQEAGETEMEKTKQSTKTDQVDEPEEISIMKRRNVKRKDVGKSSGDKSGRSEEADAVGNNKVAGPAGDAGETAASRGKVNKQAASVCVHIEENEVSARLKRAPPLLQAHLNTSSHNLQIQIPSNVTMLPQQVLILQQQIRMHVQLATTNFLQLYIHPLYWSYGPKYKEYLETFTKLVEKNPNSVVNVCNLKPAMELIEAWEKTVSADTPENAEMVKFIQQELDKCSRRFVHNNQHTGDFHDTLKQVVANSPAILYPHLLPAAPYRAEAMRRNQYLRCEDELIAMGLDQFWDYVEANPSLYKPPTTQRPNQRWGYSVTVQLVAKHMFPWMPAKVIQGHIRHLRRAKAEDNPIIKFLTTREITPVKHMLLPYNPKLTLYEHPEDEIPRVWVRYLSKTSKRFKKYLHRHKSILGGTGAGVPVELGKAIEEQEKAPLPIDFTKVIVTNRANVTHQAPKPSQPDKFDIDLTVAPIPQTQTVIFVPIKNLTQNTPINDVPVPKTHENIPIVSESTPIVVDSNVQTIPSSTVTSELDSVATTKVIKVAPNLVPSEKYKIVEMNSGVYLLPLEPVTTVNVNTTPITTPREIGSTPNVTLASGDVSAEHCECCARLRKICKRQTAITDYFKHNRNVGSSCYCKNIKYPRISKRLRMLVNNYKSRSLCHLETLRRLLSDNKMSVDEGESELEDHSADDIEYVTSFQLRLLSRIGIAKNAYLKKRVEGIFSRFNMAHGDPLVLASDLYKTFEIELADMYKEFLGFLTPEQADKIGFFKDYFRRACLRDVMKKINELVLDKDERVRILAHLNTVLHSPSTSCQMCCSLLERVHRSPKLAEYMFSLFPHRRTKDVEATEGTKPQPKKATLSVVATTMCATQVVATPVVATSPRSTQPTSTPITIAPKLFLMPVIRNGKHTTVIGPLVSMPVAPKPLVIEPLISKQTSPSEKNGADETVQTDVHTEMDYDNDDNSSAEEDETAVPEPDAKDSHDVKPQEILEDSPESSPEDGPEDSSEDSSDDHLVIKTEELEDGECTRHDEINMEDQDSCDSTNTSMCIVFEDETVKPEAPEWKRDEDKLILEVLKEHITPEERRNRTILEILLEKNIFEIIAESLGHKTFDEVKNRVLYLLQFLILRDK